MNTEFTIGALWLLFAATHLGLSSLRLRPHLIRALGERPFQGVYSLIAAVLLTAVFWVYLTHRHQGPLLWAIPLGTTGLWATYVLQGVAWTLVAAGALQPSPVLTAAFTDSSPERIEVRGVQRITRHAVFMGISLFSALHLLGNGFLTDVVFWAGIPIFGLVGCWHQDRRKLATEGEAFRAWHAATPFLPFTGRETLRGLREIPPLAVGIGVGLAVVFRLLHGPLWG